MISINLEERRVHIHEDLSMRDGYSRLKEMWYHNKKNLLCYEFPIRWVNETEDWDNQDAYEWYSLGKWTVTHGEDTLTEIPTLTEKVDL